MFFPIARSNFFQEGWGLASDLMFNTEETKSFTGSDSTVFDKGAGAFLFILYSMLYLPCAVVDVLATLFTCGSEPTSNSEPLINS